MTTTDRKRDRFGRLVDTQEKKSSSGLSNIIPILLILAGVFVMMYQVIGVQYNNMWQNNAAKQMNEEVASAQETGPDKLQQRIIDAQQYNNTMPSVPISDPWTAEDHNENNPEYKEYLGQLNDFSAMSTVTIPSINSSLPLYHGTAPSTLDRGLGHLYGTSLPVGGKGSHSVITGHTGLRQATMWDHLVDVEIGDEIFYQTYGETFKYQVYATDVVLPTDTDSIMFNDENRELLTLITCTPYGVNSHRLLVYAERVPMEEEDYEKIEESNNVYLENWMIAVIVISLLLILVMIIMAIRSLRNRAK